MDNQNFIRSWPAFWLWLKHLDQKLIGSHIQTAYTFRKSRLDIHFINGDQGYRLSWEKQGNQALLTLSTQFTLPKKRVKLLGEFPHDVELQNVQINASDRVLRLNFSKGNSLILGFFPTALNVFHHRDGIMVDSFLKQQNSPTLSTTWLSPTDPLPDDIPGNKISRHDLKETEAGIPVDPVNYEVSFKDLDVCTRLTIPEFVIQVLRTSPKPKAAPTISIQKTGETVLKRWKSKLVKIQNELEEAKSWPELELQLHALQIGLGIDHIYRQGEVTLEAELSPTGKTMAFKVDSSLTLTEAIESTAKKIRKFKEKLEKLKDIIPTIEIDIQSLTLLINDKDDDALNGFLKENGEALDRSGRRQTERKPYKKHLSPSGFDILVGRGSSDNDVLTFKVANKNDWWFHARQIRGSHVVLRTSNREPQRADILKAAQLAAVNSKAKHSGIVVVQYCQRKHLSKPKGSSPGTVLVHQENTITVDLDQID